MFCLVIITQFWRRKRPYQLIFKHNKGEYWENEAFEQIWVGLMCWSWLIISIFSYAKRNKIYFTAYILWNICDLNLATSKINNTQGWWHQSDTMNTLSLQRFGKIPAPSMMVKIITPPLKKPPLPANVNSGASLVDIFMRSSMVHYKENWSPVQIRCIFQPCKWYMHKLNTNSTKVLSTL